MTSLPETESREDAVEQILIDGAPRDRSQGGKRRPEIGGDELHPELRRRPRGAFESGFRLPKRGALPQADPESRSGARLAAQHPCDEASEIQEPLPAARRGPDGFAEAEAPPRRLLVRKIALVQHQNRGTARGLQR